MSLSIPPPRAECADSKQYEQEVLYCQFSINNFSTDGQKRFRWNRFDLSVAEVAIGSPRTVLQLCEGLQLQHFLRGFGMPTENSPLESKFAAQAVAGTGFLSLAGTEKSQSSGGRGRNEYPCPQLLGK